MRRVDDRGRRHARETCRFCVRVSETCRLCVRLIETCRFWAERVHTSGQDLEKTWLFKDPEQIGHFEACK